MPVLLSEVLILQRLEQVLGQAQGIHFVRPSTVVIASSIKAGL